MKHLFIIAFLFIGTLMTSCKDKNANEAIKSEEIKTDTTGPEYTSAYICPMHCKGSGSDQAGKCPSCGMDYVENKDFNKSDVHPEETGEHHDHDGHEHN